MRQGGSLGVGDQIWFKGEKTPFQTKNTASGNTSGQNRLRKLNFAFLFLTWYHVWFILFIFFKWLDLSVSQAFVLNVMSNHFNCQDSTLGMFEKCLCANQEKSVLRSHDL